MAHLRDVCFHRLAWLVAVPLLTLTLPARSGAGIDEAPGDAVAQDLPAITMPAGAIADPPVTEAAAVVAPTEDRPRSDDQQRRVLMLLLMNSAGPVRPYGNLGR